MKKIFIILTMIITQFAIAADKEVDFKWSVAGQDMDIRFVNGTPNKIVIPNENQDVYIYATNNRDSSGRSIPLDSNVVEQIIQNNKLVLYNGLLTSDVTLEIFDETTPNNSEMVLYLYNRTLKQSTLAKSSISNDAPISYFRVKRSEFHIPKENTENFLTFNEVYGNEEVLDDGFVRAKDLSLHTIGKIGKGQYNDRSKLTDPEYRKNFINDLTNHPVSGYEVYKYIDEKVGNTAKIGLAGTASAIAHSQLSYTFAPETSNSIGVGVGYYAKHGAVAIGYARQFLNNQLSIRISTSYNTAGEFGAGTGMNYSW